MISGERAHLCFVDHEYIDQVEQVAVDLTRRSGIEDDTRTRLARVCGQLCIRGGGDFLLQTNTVEARSSRPLHHWVRRAHWRPQLQQLRFRRRR